MLRDGAVLPDSVKSVIQLLSRGTGEPGRMTRGKVAKCARDMVGECRRCTKVVCRVRDIHLATKVLSLTLSRTALSNLHPKPPYKVASAVSVDLAVPLLFLPIYPTHPTHIWTPGPKTALQPLPSRAHPAIAKRRFGYARNADRPCAVMIRHTVESGPGAHGTARTWAVLARVLVKAARA
jgi:hypothetical protein